MKSYASSVFRHFWLWGPSGAVGSLLTYAVAGPSTFVLAGIAAGIAPVWLGAWHYQQRTDSTKTVSDAERMDEAVPAAEAWLEHEPASDLTDAPHAAEEAAAPGTPRLRLLQPYERPLLPFTGSAPPPADEHDGDEEPLEITVDELLVDLEETLSLIRRLKDKHSNETFTHQSS